MQRYGHIKIIKTVSEWDVSINHAAHVSYIYVTCWMKNGGTNVSICICMNGCNCLCSLSLCLLCFIMLCCWLFAGCQRLKQCLNQQWFYVHHYYKHQTSHPSISMNQLHDIIPVRHRSRNPGKLATRAALATQKSIHACLRSSHYIHIIHIIRTTKSLVNSHNGAHGYCYMLRYI